MAFDMTAHGLDGLVKKMHKESDSTINRDDLKNSAVVNIEENIWPVGTKTEGMKEMTKEQLISCMFKRTKIRERELANPLIGICLPTNHGAKVLYLSSLTKGLTPYDMVGGVPMRADKDVVFSEATVNKAARDCNTAEEIVDNVLFGKEIEVKGQTKTVTVAKFNSQGDIVGITPAKLNNYEYVKENA